MIIRIVLATYGKPLNYDLQIYGTNGIVSKAKDRIVNFE